MVSGPHLADSLKRGIIFVLEAVADVETAVTHIRALADPPKVESGPVIKVGNRSWIMESDPGEVLVAIEDVLVDE